MKHADVRRCELAAADLLCRQNFSSIYDLRDMDIRKFSFPVSVEFDSFGGFCEAAGIGRAEITQGGLAEGLSLRHGGKFLVLYNESAPRSRQNWTLAHEAGHILLGHIGEEGAHLEREADCFAASLLCPAVAVHYLAQQYGHPLSPKELQAVFPLSYEAAKRRASELQSAAPIPPSEGEIALLLALFGRFSANGNKR